jgi:hypothetical protein
MTPYKHPGTPEERSYNKCHKKERVIIERCFGQLKKRIPILQGRVRLQLRKVPGVIVACCVLHNIAKYLQDPDDFPDYVETLLGDDEAADIYDERIRRRGQIAAIIHDTI